MNQRAPKDKDEAGSQEPPPPRLTFAPIRDPRLRPRDCQVLWALCHWAWGSKPNCWPTNAQVAALIGCSPRTVVFSIGRLVAAGYLLRTMVRCDRGWYRALTFAERASRPDLRIVEPAGGGRAIPDGGGRAIPVGGVAQSLSTPPAQGVAREDFSENQKENNPNGVAVGPEEAPTTPGPAEPGEREPGPAPFDVVEVWASSVDVRTTADLDHWRAVAAKLGTANAMGRVARKILGRWEGTALIEVEPRRPRARLGNGPAPGSPARDPRGPSFEGDDPRHAGGDPTKDGPASQYYADKTEHKFH